MTDYCPNCKKSNELSTPRSSTTIAGKRNTKSHGIKICNRCEIIITKNKKIRFWTGKIIVSLDDNL